MDPTRHLVLPHNDAPCQGAANSDFSSKDGFLTSWTLCRCFFLHFSVKNLSFLSDDGECLVLHADDGQPLALSNLALSPVICFAFLLEMNLLRSARNFDVRFSIICGLHRAFRRWCILKCIELWNRGSYMRCPIRNRRSECGATALGKVAIFWAILICILDFMAGKMRSFSFQRAGVFLFLPLLTWPVPG